VAAEKEEEGEALAALGEQVEWAVLVAAELLVVQEVQEVQLVLSVLGHAAVWDSFLGRGCSQAC
jgi:hypothetical protein